MREPRLFSFIAPRSIILSLSRPVLEVGRPYFSVELGYREIPPNLAESYHVAERSESSSSGAEAYPIATGYDFPRKEVSSMWLLFLLKRGGTLKW